MYKVILYGVIYYFLNEILKFCSTVFIITCYYSV